MNKSKYKIEVENAASYILKRKHLGIDDQIVSLYHRLESEGVNPQFALDVQKYIVEVTI